MTMTRNVDGHDVPLTAAEEQAITAEWLANAPKERPLDAQLSDTDHVMVFICEKLIRVLINKGVISRADFPNQMLAVLDARLAAENK